MAFSDDPDCRAEFQQQLTRRFAEFQSKGLNASDAAGLSLKVAAGQINAPVDVVQLADAIEANGTGGNGSDGSRDAKPSLDAAVSTGVRDLFSSAPTLVLSLARAHTASDAQEQSAQSRATLDWALVDRLASALDGSHSRPAMLEAVSGATQLVSDLSVDDGKPDWWINGQAMVALCCMPWTVDPLHEELLVLLVITLSAWPDPHSASFVEALSRVPRKAMSDLVGSKLLQFIVLRLMATNMLDDGVTSAVEVLDLVFQANERAGLIERSRFHCDAINQEEFDLKSDYIRWRRKSFSFAAHAFMYEPAAKAELLRIENQLEMANEVRDAVMMEMMRGAIHHMPYFVLKVRRQQLLNDTVLQMRRAHKSLKRPLKVKFIGEEGVDEGGVTKEFFQLLTDQLLNPDFGMFEVDPDTRQLWFRASQQLLQLEEFKLVGNLVGLAIYNSVILDVTFPQVLYKKLLGEALVVEDLRGLHPAVYDNLMKLRSHAGSFEDLGLVFQVEQENEWKDGFTLVDLKANGSSVPVTANNVEEYVQAYARFLLTDSVEAQFDAFLAGFQQVCDGPAMSLFFPEELELLVCGGRDMDFHALEKNSRVEGFGPDAEVVRWFWEIVHSYSEQQQRNLLAFVTGSDRVPINGLGALTPPFVIHRNGDAGDRLPTAHTCFNALMLSGGYKDKATLDRVLAVAIEHSEGFGLQ